MDLLPSHIRAGRALVGATQQDLADAAKLSLATLNNIEREVAHPRPKTLERIRQALRDGGVNITANGTVETLTMERFGHIAIEDDMPIRTTLLRMVETKNLLKVERVLVFSIKDDFHRCGILLKGAYRNAMFAHPGIDIRNRIGLAELAAFVIGAFKSVNQHLCFSNTSIDHNQLHLEGAEAVSALPHEQTFAGFLAQQFPESQAIINAAKSSDRHPLSHVLRVFEKM